MQHTISNYMHSVCLSFVRSRSDNRPFWHTSLSPYLHHVCFKYCCNFVVFFFRFLMTLLKQRAILSSGRSLKLSSVSYFNKRLSWNRFYSEYLPFLPFSHTLVQGRFVPAWTAGRKARSQRIVLSGFLRWIIHSWRNAFYLKYILILKRNSNSNSIYFIQHCAL